MGGRCLEDRWLGDAFENIDMAMLAGLGIHKFKLGYSVDTASRPRL